MASDARDDIDTIREINYDAFVHSKKNQDFTLLF